MRLRIAVLLALATVGARADDAQLASAVERVVKSGERGVWRRAEAEPPVEATARDLFAYAFALAEARQTERLGRLYEVAARLQDRDPQSRTYGNFRWYWKNERPEDLNAVDFCMQHGVLTWLRDRDVLPAPVRDQLRELLTLGIEGSLRHRVPESYTNIALMNAANLALLGEALDKPAVADEGYRRLDRVAAYTWEAGIHEYASPTYYGVDLDDLVLLERYGRRPAGKQVAQALLKLFWADLAANWFAPADKLTGARSRDYDYLHGLGSLDQQLAAAGWLPAEQIGGNLLAAVGTWRPEPGLKARTAEFPRWVRASWGMSNAESRSQLLLPDVTLGSSGAGYPDMDIPLAVDFAGPRNQVRGYYLPDGRHDPYGKIRVAAGGGHEKTLHLRPFFAAAQARRDALSLNVYRDRDLPAGTATLESHFVLPWDATGYSIGEQPLPLTAKQPCERVLAPGEAVVLRRGTAAVGVRVVWARDRAGQPAEVKFVDDANAWGAVRITVNHRAGASGAEAGAAFWVRIGSGLDDAAFAAWRRAFLAATPEVTAGAQGVSLRATGLDGELAVAAAPPYQVPSQLEPTPYRGVLEVNGQELGRPLLDELPAVAAARRELAGLKPIDVPAGGLGWEAEAGALRPMMERGDDPQASGGRFIWMPGEVGGKGGASGQVTWALRLPVVKAWYLWARVLTPTPEDDSFYVRAATAEREVLPQSTLACGTHTKWEWIPVRFEPGTGPAPLALPAGEVRLQFMVREDGAKLDRLFLTADPQATPK